MSRIYGVNGILIGLRTSRATEQTYQGLPPVVETPRHEANLVRCINVQFDHNLCVVYHMYKLEERKINNRGRGWPKLKKERQQLVEPNVE